MSSKSRSRSKSRHKKSAHKHKSKRRSEISSSSSSSSDEEKSIELLKKLEEKRYNDAAERKRLKEEMKMTETPEQKRARRLAEKQAKKIRHRERMGWDTEYQHYTNQDNPFGDANLTSSFVWNKKLEKEGLNNVPQSTVEVMYKRKQIENKIELEKVKKRRKERELERQAREEEILLQQRSREAAQFEEWEKHEDKFHLEQARLRSTIRIRDGRAKPIDLLAQYISNSNLEETIEMQMHEPYTFLNGLNIHDLEDLLADIKVYIELEKGNNSDFWTDMILIVEDELQKLQKIETGGEFNATVGRREGVHQSVAKHVSDIFRGKTAQQLEELKEQIETKIKNKRDGVDVSYWESLLSQLKAHMARARLRDRHQERLKQKLDLLRTSNAEDQNVEYKKLESKNYDSNAVNKTENSGDEANEHESESKADLLIEASINLYEEGCYSPHYTPVDNIPEGVYIITPEDADQAILALRESLLERNNEDDTLSREELLLQREARSGMDADEAQFSVETKLDSQVYLWSDKYRPRKPRYFNRVHTGFEWNKYNQTHYDMDNPPPKIVQGYKFNIFYPDLIDKSCTPQHFLMPCPDNTDFAILRFHSGPPYEDIAFKIVNREWEFSYKRGFRCQFHNNIFQLWFHFKRYRYRR